MIMTEEEARKKWCPMVRAEDVPPDNDGVHRPRCIASGCMAWRVIDRLSACGHVHHINDKSCAIHLTDECRLTERGYCGLAVKP